MAVGIDFDNRLVENYTECGIGYLSEEKLEQVGNFRFALFPRDPLSGAYELGPIRTSNGSEVNFFLYTSANYNDYGLRIVDDDCFSYLSGLIDVQFAALDEKAEVSPITGTIELIY